jgi:hypothetical protein
LSDDVEQLSKRVDALEINLKENALRNDKDHEEIKGQIQSGFKAIETNFNLAQLLVKWVIVPMLGGLVMVIGIKLVLPGGVV